MGDAAAAKGFYERAASLPIAFYGQLAAKRLGQTSLALRAPKAAAEGDRRDEAVGAAASLYADGLDDLAASLAFDAARRWDDELQIAAMAEVVKRFDDAGTQVQFGKFALMRGYPFDAMAFPAAGMPAFVPLAHSADLPTVYAVARQESEFIWHSSSWAGAKGLMQMLPSTAASTARRAGVEFDYARLIVDPAFNTRLGASLLGQLIEDEGGSRELAFAAYNAGPGRVAQWIAAHGDRARKRRSRRLDRADPVRRNARLCAAGQREPRRLSPALRRRAPGAAASIGAARARVGAEEAGGRGRRRRSPLFFQQRLDSRDEARHVDVIGELRILVVPRILQENFLRLVLEQHHVVELVHRPEM